MINILDPNDKRIEEFTHLKESTLLSRDLALAESEKIYIKLINHGHKIEKILCLPDFAEKYNLSGDNVFVADRSILEKISGFKIEFNVICLFKRPNFTELNKLDNKIMILNGLTSPENVGAIVRTAAAFNVNSLIYDKKSCSPYLRRCIRVSMGNIFQLKIYESNDLLKDLANLKNLGYSVHSTANISRSIDYTNYTYPQKSALIVGSEGHGIDSDVLDASDFILKIPINEEVAHLNASNAASIFLSVFNR